MPLRILGGARQGIENRAWSEFDVAKGKPSRSNVTV